ncbi:MAG: epimerase, partial [Chryseobacterium sp.]
EAVNTFGPAGGYFGFASNSLCNADKARTELNWKPQHHSIENFI